MAHHAKINSAVLTWARERAGLPVDKAAKLIGLRPARGQSAATRLAAMEAGDAYPTYTQLNRIADVYHWPPITFFMPEPPEEPMQFDDFRGLTTRPDTEEAARLDLLLSDFWSRYEIARSIIEDAPGNGEKLDIVGSLSTETPLEMAKEEICSALSLDMDEGPPAEARSPEALFNFLRARVEDLGVFVVLAGDLGSNRTAIGEHVYRGFTIADSLVSFIVINDRAPRKTWAFTLINELVHLCLGNSGISALPSVSTARSPAARIEHYCNRVATEVLVPTKAVTQFSNTKPLDETTAPRAIARCARAYKVDQATIAYRLRSAGVLSHAMHQRLLQRPISNSGTKRVTGSKPRLPAHRGTNGSSRKTASVDQATAEPPGSKRTVKRSLVHTPQYKLGNLYADFVRDALDSRDVNFNEASALLGVPPSGVYAMLHPGSARVALTKEEVQKLDIFA